MNISKFSLLNLLCFIQLAVSSLTITSTHAATFDVDSFIDDSIPTFACINFQTGCTLRTALITINDNTAGPGPHIINLNSSADHVISIAGSGEDDALNGDLDINNIASGDITIRSASGTAVILANLGLNERIFHIVDLSDGATIIFQNIVIQRASGGTAQIGAGIYYAADEGVGSTTTFQLSNVTINNNSVATTGDGGGIYIDTTNDSVSITGSTITGANVTGSGGAIYNNAGTNGTVSIDGSTISSSTALVSGGGIYNNTNSTISITNSIVSSNSSTLSGGGIYNIGTTTLSSSTVSGNSSNTTGAGGGIYNGITGSITLKDSTLTSNTDNGSLAGGGGLFNSGAATLNRSTVGPTNHSATDGGGIYNVTTSTLTMINSTISGNTTDGDGGGVYVLGGTVNIRNSTIANNTADNNGDGGGAEGGGGIFRIADPVTLYNSIVADNRTLTGTNHDCSGTVVDGGYNIIEDITGCIEGGGTTNADPNLAALTNNGGASQTHALNSLSIAIDAGNPGPTGAPPLCEAEDQTGKTRPLDGDGDTTALCDIGAYENPVPGGGGGGGGCYIATAAYGTAMEKDVVTLRYFRDRYLLTNKPGKLFTELYYKLSPPVAAKISTNETLREWARASLVPLVSLGRLLDDANVKNN